MNVEAGVAQLGDLLSQELHSLGGIAEDNWLIDLKLWRRGRPTSTIHVSGYDITLRLHNIYNKSGVLLKSKVAFKTE